MSVVKTTRSQQIPYGLRHKDDTLGLLYSRRYRRLSIQQPNQVQWDGVFSLSSIGASNEAVGNMGSAKYKQQSRASEAQLSARERLYALYDESPLPREDLLVNLGLYTRASALARIFFLNEIYEQITAIPGCVMEFGTWWGQRIVTFENLRAIHEPYNHARRVIGFDTFAGYPKNW